MYEEQMIHKSVSALTTVVQIALLLVAIGLPIFFSYQGSL